MWNKAGSSVEGAHGAPSFRDAALVRFVLTTAASVFLATLCVASLSLSVSLASVGETENSGLLGSLFGIVDASTFFFALLGLFVWTLAIGFLLLNPRGRSLHVGPVVLGFIWSALWVVGKLPMFDEPNIVFAILSLLGGWLAFFLVLTALWNAVDDLRLLRRPALSGVSARLRTALLRHPVGVPMACVFVCWLPYLVLLYPGITAPNDTLDQLQQFFGIESFTSKMAGQVKEGVFLNSQHSVLHTFLLGLFVKSGTVLGSTNLGFFVFVLLQSVIMAWGVACLLSVFIRRVKTVWPQVVIGAGFALLPVFPLMAVVATKDIPFTGFFCVFVARLLDASFDDDLKHSPRFQLSLVILSLLIILTRQTGVYLVAGILAVGLLGDALRKRFAHAGMLFGLGIGCIVVYALYPALGIAPGSRGEMLAVPYAQVARIITLHGDQLTGEDRSAIDAELDYDGIPKRYNPVVIDDVKAKRRLAETPEEQKTFKRTWLDLVRRYPMDAFEAWAFLWRGYLSPNALCGFVWTSTTGWYDGMTGEFVDQSGMYDALGINLRQAGAPATLRKSLEDRMESLFYRPAGIPMNLGLYSWLVLLSFFLLLHLRRWELLEPVLLLGMLSASLLLSPANGVVRYVLPLYYAAPVACAMLVIRSEDCEAETLAGPGDSVVA